MKDMIGLVCGRLKVVGRSGPRNGRATWNCVCECGNQVEVIGKLLRRGETCSCGCLRRDIATSSHLRHGHARRSGHSPTHKIWSGMLNRCLNQNDSAFQKYGAKGITVCERWMTFENFLSDMGEKPNGLTLDRKKNDLGYSKEHCRLASQKQQQNNRTNNFTLTVDGVTKTAAEWASIKAVKPHTIIARSRSGWSDEDAVNVPVKTPTRDYTGQGYFFHKTNKQTQLKL